MQSSPRPVGFFQIAVLILSIYAFVALLADTFFQLPTEVSLLIQIFDTMVCAVFLIDFCIQFNRAEKKLAYLKTGWIDLLASIPTVDVLRWGRMIRVLQILRVLRAIRATHKVVKLLTSRKNVAGSVGLTAGMLIVFSSMAIIIAENVPDSNIKTAGDALWWSCTTITTVGYGDRYPVTAEGRVIAVVLMLAGVGLFGSFTALVAAYFTGKEEESDEHNSLATDISKLRKLLEQIQMGTSVKPMDVVQESPVLLVVGQQPEEPKKLP
jgi:voltage-gated potassium channel